jgi:hypothetical protein
MFIIIVIRQAEFSVMIFEKKINWCVQAMVFLLGDL